MIVYLPNLYENEIIYSLLARTYDKSGYLTNGQAMRDFFKSKRPKFDYMFYNNLSEDLILKLKHKYKMSDIIQNHTLYNYYARYLKLGKRYNATKALLKNEGKYFNAFGITTRKEYGRFLSLRFCPLCAKEQRIKYGEAYWDRRFQIPDVTVCPIHRCKILRCENNKISTCFYSADNYIDSEYDIEYGDDIDVKVAKYICKMCETKIEIFKDMRIDLFFLSRIKRTKYLSTSGKIINIFILCEDMNEFYKGKYIFYTEQISNVLHGRRRNPLEIILIAIFLNITINELLEFKIDEWQSFADIISELFINGASLNQIGKIYSLNSATIREIIVKRIGISRYEQYGAPKNGSSHDKIIERRRIWISEMEKYKGLTYTKIRKTSEFGQDLNWLRRNDKEWTDKHYPQFK